jgi:hypothetical protein
MEKEGKTQKMQMIKSDIHIPHGVDVSHSDAMAPVIINEAEKSALAVKALSNRNPGQVQVLEVTRPQPVDGNTRRNGGRKNATMSKTKSFIEGFAVICENPRLVRVETSLENAFKAVLFVELTHLAYSIEGVLDEVIEDTTYENIPDDEAHQEFRTRHLARALEDTIQEHLEAQFVDFLSNKKGFFSSLYHPKGKGYLGLVIVKAKLDLATGRVLDVQFYNPINHVWGDPQEPTKEIRDVFEGPNGEDLQEIRKERLAKRTNKQQ